MFIYVLEDALGRIYVGITRDLQARVALHKAGKVASTKSMMFLEVAHWWNVDNYILASKFERWCHSNMSKVAELVLDCPIWNKHLRELAETKKTTPDELLRAVQYSKYREVNNG